MQRLTKYFLLIFSIPLFLMSPYQAQAKDRHERTKTYNVVFIIMTGLRPDHLGCNGYEYNISAHIDSLAQNGIYFNNAIAQSNSSPPSITSIFTSKFVSAQQINKHNQKLSDKEVTLAEILKLYGYRTAAFTCADAVSSISGLNQGFDIYHDNAGRDIRESPADIIDSARRWLEKNREEKFFLFLQSCVVHPVLDKKDAPDIISDYDKGIHGADIFIGNIIEEIRRLKLDGKTIVILSSDHGVELKRQGKPGYFAEQNLYQGLIHVPLIVSYPGMKLKNRKINSLVQLVDIAPTVLEILGIPVSHSMQGGSLLPLIRDKKYTTGYKYAYAEVNRDKWAIINKRGFKLIYSSGQRELYDLKNDPGEQNNLSSKYGDAQAELMKDFFSWRKQIERPTGGEWLELSSEMLEKLRRIGYWP